MGRIQHGGLVALGNTDPVVEAPVESIGRGLLLAACRRHLPSHFFARVKGALAGPSRPPDPALQAIRVGLRSSPHKITQ
jgi:hypothetical protein